MVRILGELWSADSKETLHIGEKVTVICVQGNSVLVKHGNG
jgi:membrane protein implicated in regulation of membrane protease activity